MSVLAGRAGRAATKHIQKDAAIKQVLYQKSIQEYAPRKDRPNPYTIETYSPYGQTLQMYPSRILFSENDLKFNYFQSWNMPKDNLILKCTPAKSNSPSSESPGRGNPEQLLIIQEKLANNLPKLFVTAMDYSYYRPDLVFVNNIKGTKTAGIYHYVKQVSLLRAVGHLKYAYITLEIIKITTRPEDSSVIVRWRIKGINGFKALFTFWKIKLWKFREIFHDEETWYDGLSVFYVGSDGKIHTHVVDKMQPDEENSVDEIVPKSPIAAKLALTLGLIPKGQLCGIPSLTSALAFFDRKTVKPQD